ncbi:rhomboid family intramembrane serine protease [Flavisphingomonas formosensis]|uniref:rhomboid family intramembrane serine protease n=1 Tax=Flavisphingomonas formosensis TaxID=861534 RepID=UPI0012FA4E93|nr:rhomboid family intramembrane serine protease [Sphingomonas formosensis]
MQGPRVRATNAIAGVTVLAWAAVAMLGLQQQAWTMGAFVPARVGEPLGAAAIPFWLTPLTATLLHGGLLHLTLNLVMFFYCGRQVELALGSAGLVLLYLIGAYAAALGQYLHDPASQVAMIGASGAISAVFGAYALLYGRRRLIGGNARVSGVLNLLWLLAAWVGLQLLIGIATSGGGMLVAIWAHIGGFMAGLIFTRPLLMWRYRHA